VFLTNPKTKPENKKEPIKAEPTNPPTRA